MEFKTSTLDPQAWSLNSSRLAPADSLLNTLAHTVAAPANFQHPKHSTVLSKPKNSSTKSQTRR